MFSLKIQCDKRFNLNKGLLMCLFRLTWTFTCSQYNREIFLSLFHCTTKKKIFLVTCLEWLLLHKTTIWRCSQTFYTYKWQWIAEEEPGTAHLPFFFMHWSEQTNRIWKSDQIFVCFKLLLVFYNIPAVRPLNSNGSNQVDIYILEIML